jgi:hypothetical protein
MRTLVSVGAIAIIFSLVGEGRMAEIGASAQSQGLFNETITGPTVHRTEKLWPNIEADQFEGNRRKCSNCIGIGGAVLIPPPPLFLTDLACRGLLACHPKKFLN